MTEREYKSHMIAISYKGENKSRIKPMFFKAVETDDGDLGIAKSIPNDDLYLIRAILKNDPNAAISVSSLFKDGEKTEGEMWAKDSPVHLAVIKAIQGK